MKYSHAMKVKKFMRRHPGTKLGTASRAVAKHRSNPSGNPWYEKRPARRHAAAARKGWRLYKSRGHARRRNPEPQIKQVMQFGWWKDAATAAGGMIATQKVSELIKQTGWTDVLVTGIVAVGLAVGAGKFAGQKVGENIGIGGGVAAVLKAVAQFPQLSAFASKGSIVVGGGGPRIAPRVMLPTRAMPMASLPPLRRL